MSAYQDAWFPTAEGAIVPAQSRARWHRLLSASAIPRSREGFVNSDRPIESAKADKLHRADLAASLAQHIAAIPAGPGQVLALFGPWGAGKTSVLKTICDA
jgi:flagellar biosynthesis/type III secretory pathway ATPase